MSKRYKPTIADRYYERAAKDAGSTAEETERLARAGDFEATLDLRAGEVDSTLEMLGLWERCRHVFQFDRSLTEALDETDLPGNMPAEALARLPYDIVFIEAPFVIHDTPCGDFEVAGAFVWLSESDGDACVKVMSIGSNLGRTFISPVPVAGRTLGEAARECSARFKRSVTRASVRTGDMTLAANNEDQVIFEVLAHVTNHVLYLSSEKLDDEVVYEPSGRSSPKRSRTQSQSVIHATGARIARLLREERKSNPCEQVPATGKRKREHYRRGHYQRYWTGRKDHPEERKPVIRWKRPIHVNAGKGDPIRDTYLHVSPRKPRS